MAAIAKKTNPSKATSSLPVNLISDGTVTPPNFFLRLTHVHNHCRLCKIFNGKQPKLRFSDS